MAKILHIMSSINGSRSVSNQLGNEIVAQIETVEPGSNVKVYDLNQMKFPHVDEVFVSALYTDVNLKTEAQAEATKISDRSIHDLLEADILVISLPMYNFGIPSTLKSWVDHIIRDGMTVRSKASGGFESLVHGKKAYLAISSGGIYTSGPYKDFDFTESYLRAVLGFVGITDVTVHRAEGTAIPALAQNALATAIESIQIKDKAMSL